jgi:hypothetical protein
MKNKSQIEEKGHSTSYKQGRKRLFIKIARLLNYFSVLVLSINTVYRMLTTFGILTTTASKGGITYLLKSLFQASFAVLLILVELRKRWLLIYIEFLRGRFGKGLILVMIGVLVFDEIRSNDMATGILIVLCGLFNIIVSCMRSDIDTIRRKHRRE